MKRQNFIVANVEGKVCICNELQVNKDLQVVRIDIRSEVAFDLLQKRFTKCKDQLEEAIYSNSIVETRVCTINGVDYPDIVFINKLTKYIHHYNQYSANIMQKIINENITLDKIEQDQVKVSNPSLYEHELYWILDQYKKAIIFSDLVEEEKLAYLEKIAYLKHIRIEGLKK